MISIPPQYAESSVVGYIKGKNAIHLSPTYGKGKQDYADQNFWALGHFLSTVGRDEAAIRDYIRNREVEDERLNR